MTSVTASHRPVLQTARMSSLLLEVLQENRRQKRFLLHEFVIMPDHFHLLLTPAPDISLEKCLQYIKGGFSFRAKKELDFRQGIWQQSFTEHRVKDAGDYGAAPRIYLAESGEEISGRGAGVVSVLVGVPRGGNRPRTPVAKATDLRLAFRGPEGPRFHRSALSRLDPSTGATDATNEAKEAENSPAIFGIWSSCDLGTAADLSNQLLLGAWLLRSGRRSKHRRVPTGFWLRADRRPSSSMVFVCFSQEDMDRLSASQKTRARGARQRVEAWAFRPTKSEAIRVALATGAPGRFSIMGPLERMKLYSAARAGGPIRVLGKPCHEACPKYRNTARIRRGAGASGPDRLPSSSCIRSTDR